MSGMSSCPVEDVLAARARLGECPLWDPDRRALDWVDIFNHRVHRFDPSTGDDRYVETPDAVAAIALADPATPDQLLIAMRDQIALLDLRTGEIEPSCRAEFSHSEARFNDGMCDTSGRFWVGTMSDEPGHAALYRYDPDGPHGSLHTMETGLTISNGLGWSPDDKTFYLTDSPARRIYAYRFDARTGAIGDRRVLVDLGEEEVEPDGLAIDRDGNLWSALWDGWCVVRFDASGRELDRIRLPVQRPTSLTFGGPGLTELYVTSATIGLSEKEVQCGLQAGDLFRIASPVSGLPTNRFAARTAAH
jgi:sugar lactone lactonase YvrE